MTTYVNWKYVKAFPDLLKESYELKSIRLVGLESSSFYAIEVEDTDLCWTVWEDNSAWDMMEKLQIAIKESRQAWEVTVTKKKPFFSLKPSSESVAWSFSVKDGCLQKLSDEQGDDSGDGFLELLEGVIEVAKQLGFNKSGAVVDLSDSKNGLSTSPPKSSRTKQTKG